MCDICESKAGGYTLFIEKTEGSMKITEAEMPGFGLITLQILFGILTRYDSNIISLLKKFFFFLLILLVYIFRAH